MINSYIEYKKMATAEKKLWWYEILHQKVINTLLKNNISKKDFIVDMGCGTGGLMEKLSTLGYNIHGIDLSEHAIDYCKKKN